MPQGNQRVEVFGDADRDARLRRDLTDVVGGQAVGVVELDELFNGDLPPAPPEVPLHQAPASLQCVQVFLALVRHHLLDLVSHRGELGEVAPPELYLGFDEVGEPVLDSDLAEEPVAPPVEEPGEVSLTDVRGDDALGEDEGQALRVVEGRINSLNR